MEFLQLSLCKIAKHWDSFLSNCIPPNEMGSPQTAHLCILPSQCPNLDPIALTILVIVNTSLVVVALVLVSYLVHLLRHALQVEVYSV